MSEQVKIASKREVKENELIDEVLRGKLSDVLNFRSNMMRDQRKLHPAVSIKQHQRKITKSLALKDYVKKKEIEWFQFCLKPVKKGLLGATTWKKVTPNREAFRVNAEHLIGQFNSQETQMFKNEGALNINPVWYKRLAIFIANLFKKDGNK